jgi:hypothetical protein
VGKLLVTGASVRESDIREDPQDLLFVLHRHGRADQSQESGAKNELIRRFLALLWQGKT